MSKESNSGGRSGSSRRRRRRSRQSKKNSSNSRRRSSSRSKKSSSRRGGRRRNGKQQRTPAEKFGGREPRDASATHHDGPLELNAFELFCAYHLGIMPDNSYKKTSLKDVARLFERSPDEIEQALKQCGMDREALRSVDYDLDLAQLDVKVAPEGIDKRELAKTLFGEFADVNPHFVDWSETVDEPN